MLTTTIAFTVPSPLAKAFNYVSDLENLPEWESYILECKRVPGTNKYELKVGIGFWKLTSCYNLEEERYPTRLVITKENRFCNCEIRIPFIPILKEPTPTRKSFLRIDSELRDLVVS